MEFQAEIDALKDSVLDEIGTAVKQGDTATITYKASILSELEIIEASYIKLEKRLCELKEGGSRSMRSKSNANYSLKPSVDQLLTPTSNTSSRSKGKEARIGLQKELDQRGIRLSRWNRSLLSREDGLMVGIAFASDTQRYPGRWFLGLPDRDDYAAIVFMCEESDGQILHFILPQDFIRTYKGKFSSSNGQLKFNVSRQMNGYHLLIPSAGSPQISGFLWKYENIVTGAEKEVVQ